MESEARALLRIRIYPDGEVRIIDPDPEVMGLVQALNPTSSSPHTPALPPPPRFGRLRRIAVPLELGSVESVSKEHLWALHDQFIASEPASESPAVSVLDLKIELARRALRSCGLCGLRCGVNRLQGERGRCGLAAEAYYRDAFVHCAEEAPINPSLVVNLQGCSWRCRYCQQFDLLSIRPDRGQILGGDFWSRIEWREARTLSWVGGNPDESVYAILRTLRAAPTDFDRPIVWNSNLYGTEVLYRILQGVVDVYVADLRYGNDECTRRWSGVGGYWATATESLRAMAEDGGLIIVRILVLPGHGECCHAPALRWLADGMRQRVMVRIMGQYHPDYRIQRGDGAMARRPGPEEVREIDALADELGLRKV
jgi:putative pyruvate formate lyase activating enzyme